MTPVCDFVGKPITVGCLCAYPLRRGSKMWLTTLRIENIDQIGDAIVLTGCDGNGRHTRTRNIRNCIVIEIPNELQTEINQGQEPQAVQGMV